MVSGLHRVDVNYRSDYLLISRKLTDAVRLSLRGDDFAVEDLAQIEDVENGESGHRDTRPY